MCYALGLEVTLPKLAGASAGGHELEQRLVFLLGLNTRTPSQIASKTPELTLVVRVVDMLRETVRRKADCVCDTTDHL